MKNHLLRLAVIGLVVMLGTSMASASTFVGSHTEHGVTYTMTYTINGDGTATVSLHVSGTFTGVPGSYLSEVEIKVGSGLATVDSFSGEGDWTGEFGGPSNASGCTDELANNGFVCASGTPLSSVDMDYTFTWVLSGQNFFDDGTEAHIGARYVDDQGNFVGFLVSASPTTTTVPEPGSMILLASGVLGLGLVRRKLRKQ